MQGGDRSSTEGDLPGPPDGAQPIRPMPGRGGSPGHANSPPDDPSPQLPRTEGPATSTIPEPTPPTRGAERWYRNDQDRYRSVHRLANPWYRRLARVVIGMSFLAAAGVGLFFGAQLVQDFLDRERLPSEGAEVPTIRSTTFEIRSTTPAPVLDGTLTLDTETKSFEYIGRGTGSQAGVQVVSPDGTTVYARRNDDAWVLAPSGDQVVEDTRRAVEYLVDDRNADAVLIRQLRRGYVDLIERTEVGEGDDELRRYEMRFDTASLRDNFPLDYQALEQNAIPGVLSVRGLEVAITVDRENVLVAVDDRGTNWSWQRLSYSDQPFRAIDPAAALLDDSIEITDGSVGDG